MKRRPLLLAALAAPTLARAQSAPPGAWPRERPVRLVVTYPPGGTTDFVARAFAQRLSEQLGQSVVVENRTGGGGAVGWGAVVRAAPDGYTLLVTDNSLATAPPLMPQLGFDPLADLTPVSLLVDYATVFVVPAELPARSWPEFLALSRRRGAGDVFYGSMGVGSSPHLYSELLQDLAQVRMTHVPFRGMGPALTDLLAGRIQLLAAAPPTVLGALRGGTVRAIAVSTAGGRIPALPDVPTFRELGLDFTYSYWYGLLGPRGLEPAIAQRLDEEVRRALAAPGFRDRFIEQGALPVAGNGEALAATMRGELARWGELIRTKDIRLE
ncbi:MAG: tripartite tricarboxylate transporter substrate binding protein [Acetobacteraceae bacterium]|nr:tripartite tricarboxylate transporter substrate binding protein [Acetobacteraceae bacterium]